MRGFVLNSALDESVVGVGIPLLSGCSDGNVADGKVPARAPEVPHVASPV